MAVNDWWTSDPTERFWMEITYRDDIGGDLLAPQLNNAGEDYWSYTLVTYVIPGDIVLHWCAQPRFALTGRSLVVGQARPTRMNWESPAVPAHERTVQGKRPAWRAKLGEYRPLPHPVSLDGIRAHETGVRRVWDTLRDRVDGGLYFPFELSDKRPLRPAQGYLVKFPKDLLTVLPGLNSLADLAVAAPGTDPDPSVAPAPAQPTRAGRQPNPLRRTAIERHAVAVVTRRYELQAWKVQDVGAHESWDLTATRGADELHIEVKGSTGTRDAVDLTDGEVRHANGYETVLAVVDQISIDATNTCTAGRLRLWHGWVPDRADLIPTAYRYALPQPADEVHAA